mgnify:FL=1
MSEVVNIKIAKIGRKEMPSKFKEGATYNITTVMDEISGRKGAAMGVFADNWKVGDIVKGIWEEKKYIDKDGFEQKSWNIKNPEQKKFTSGSYGPRKATLVDAYTIAATLAPSLFKDKKTLKFSDISKLADEIMKKLETAPATTETENAKNVKTVDLDEEEKTGKSKAEKDDDFDVVDKPAEDDSTDDDEDIFS